MTDSHIARCFYCRLEPDSGSTTRVLGVVGDFSNEFRFRCRQEAKASFRSDASGLREDGFGVDGLHVPAVVLSQAAFDLLLP